MASTVRRIKLGSQGLEVSAQGLGCMGMSPFSGPPKSEPDMIALLHHAVDSGVTFLDTSDIYGPHTNEILLGKALKGGARQKVELATKFGGCFVDGKAEIRGDPAYVRAACEASLKRLDVDCIDLYYQHRIDTRVPIEVTIGELKNLVEEGKIKYIGLSEASASTIRRAHAVHPITAVQLEWSLWTRDVEAEIVPTCRKLGIGIVAYSPLGRGFFSVGSKLLENFTEDDFRWSIPRFQPENFAHNAKLFDQGDDVCPIPGTTKIENFNQNIGALSMKLTPEEMAELELIASADNVKGWQVRKQHAYVGKLRYSTPFFMETRLRLRRTTLPPPPTSHVASPSDEPRRTTPFDEPRPALYHCAAAASSGDASASTSKAVLDSSIIRHPQSTATLFFLSSGASSTPPSSVIYKASPPPASLVVEVQFRPLPSPLTAAVWNAQRGCRRPNTPSRAVAALVPDSRVSSSQLRALRFRHRGVGTYGVRAARFEWLDSEQGRVPHDANLWLEDPS
ncbi:hypothetical protein NL676_021587 [Syzygium grande]|nr:hypothetical protein NL676_021587 [Syzygium grande]